MCQYLHEMTPRFVILMPLAMNANRLTVGVLMSCKSVHSHTFAKMHDLTLYNNETCHLPFSSSLLLEGYYYSGGSGPGSLGEAFLQQDHRFVTDSVTKDVLNEPSTRAALSSELGYALGYSVEGATPTDEPAAGTSKLKFITTIWACIVLSQQSSEEKVTGGGKRQPFPPVFFSLMSCSNCYTTDQLTCTCTALILIVHEK